MHEGSSLLEFCPTLCPVNTLVGSIAYKAVDEGDKGFPLVPSIDMSRIHSILQPCVVAYLAIVINDIHPMLKGSIQCQKKQLK
jgi:hypothetical protein